jgi:hypothetical protein
MNNQFVVPQFIDVEDKIIGPVTTRQFVIMLVTILTGFIVYKLADLTLMIVINVPLGIFGLVLAFVKVNGVPFHFFLLNVIQTFKRSPIRVWNKNLSDAEIIALAQVELPPPPAPKIYKEAPPSSRLNQLALVVNTGGVYNPDEE